MNQAEYIQALKRAAWDNHDLALFEFYNHLEYDLQRLRAVGRAIAGLYEKGGSDATWNALFEALFDAGLLTEPDIQEDG